MPDISTQQAIANLTLRFNQFIENAKKVNELDPQTVLNAESKLHVMLGGVSQYLTVQQILDAFIAETYKELISVGSIVLDDQDLNFTDIVWKIQDVQYTKSDVFTIPLTTSGNIRSDIFVGYDTGEIERISGVQGLIATVPNTPDNAVLITSINVNSAAVESPADPNLGLTFLEKEYFSIFTYNSSGIVGTANIDGKIGGLKFTGSITELSSLQKNTPTIVNGMPFSIQIATGGNLLLKHNSGSGNIKFDFGGADRLARNGETLYFLQTPGVYKFIASSFGNFPEAPENGKPFARQDGTWNDLTPYFDSKLTIYNNINSNTTAPLNSHLNVIATCTITDPTPVSGKGYYEVNVVNGTATVGGVAYGVGTSIKRTFDTTWKTSVYYSRKPIVTNATVSGTFNLDPTLTDTYNLTLTGNTTLVPANFSDVFAEPMTGRVVGNFSLAYTGIIVIGAYIGTKKNRFTLERIGSEYLLTWLNYD